MAGFNRVSHLFARAFSLLALGLGLALLAGCATPTPYVPREKDSKVGYTDRELTPTRYRVTFTGNSVTPRETVESYLLLRAAEVSLAAGYNSFVFDTRNTQAHTTYQYMGPGPDPLLGPGPYWGAGFGFRRGWGGGWGGGWGPAYDPAFDVVANTKFEAYAEIVLLTPDQAKKEARAVNAKEVISHLGPDAAPPAPDTPPAPKSPA